MLNTLQIISFLSKTFKHGFIIIFQNRFEFPATVFTLKHGGGGLKLMKIRSLKCDYLLTIKNELRGSKKKRQFCIIFIIYFTQINKKIIKKLLYL